MYRSISENMMDAERLLELFQTKPSIIDDKDAKPLKFVKGEVSFKNVSFTYDGRRTSLKGVDFAVAGGSTVGIVGETGGGKSTILRLLDRFYDATDGSIEIDGQDIRKITLKRYVFYTITKLLVAVQKRNQTNEGDMISVCARALAWLLRTLCSSTTLL